jgi:hypothetical protein
MKKVLLYAIIIVVTLPVFTFAQAPDTLWTKTFGGSADDYASAVLQTNEGGYIIVGTTHSFGAGAGDTWLIRTNLSGDTIWTKTYGTGYPETAGDIQPTVDGGYVIAGSGYAPPGYIVGWIMKVDSSGNEVWSAVFDCGLGSGLSAVKQTSDGGYIAAGSVGDNRYNWAFLVKTDSAGNAIWDSVYQHSWYPHASGISAALETNDGSFIAVGGCNGFIYNMKTNMLGSTIWYNLYSIGDGLSIQYTLDSNFVMTGHIGDYWNGEASVVLLKFSDAGNSQWIKEYGGSANDGANDVVATSDSGYVLVGYTESYGAGNADIWILKANTYGDTVWTVVYGGADRDIGNCVQETQDGGYILVATTASFGSGGHDIQLIKFAPDVGINEIQDEVTDEWKHGTTIVAGPLQPPLQTDYQIIDIAGRQIHTLDPAPGIYFIEVDGEIRQKVIKIK